MKSCCRPIRSRTDGYVFQVTVEAEESFPEIHSWCFENINRGHWAASERLLRFYFEKEKDAMLFRMWWC